MIAGSERIHRKGMEIPVQAMCMEKSGCMMYMSLSKLGRPDTGIRYI